jgi:hypothetical protein
MNRIDVGTFQKAALHDGSRKNTHAIEDAAGFPRNPAIVDRDIRARDKRTSHSHKQALVIVDKMPGSISFKRDRPFSNQPPRAVEHDESALASDGKIERPACAP